MSTACVCDAYSIRAFLIINNRSHISDDEHKRQYLDGVQTLLLTRHFIILTIFPFNASAIRWDQIVVCFMDSQDRMIELIANCSTCHAGFSAFGLRSEAKHSCAARGD